MRYLLLLLGLCLVACNSQKINENHTSVTIHVSKAGSLDSLLGEYKRENIDTLVLIGKINEWDMITLQSLDSLSYLDLEETTIKHIQPKAFIGNDKLQTVILPDDISVGYGAFSNCKNLERLVSKQALFDITFDKWLEELGYYCKGGKLTDEYSHYWDSIPNLSDDVIAILLKDLNVYAHLSIAKEIEECARAYYRDRFNSISGFYITCFEERLNQYYLDKVYRDAFISEDDIDREVYRGYTFERRVSEEKRPELDAKAQSMREWNKMLKKNRELFEAYLESCQELYVNSFLSAEGNWPKFGTYDNYTSHIDFIKSCTDNRFAY